MADDGSAQFYQDKLDFAAANSKSVPCSCGGTYTTGQYERHTGTDKHRAYVAAYCGRPYPSDTPMGLEDDRAGEDQ